MRNPTQQMDILALATVILSQLQNRPVAEVLPEVAGSLKQVSALLRLPTPRKARARLNRASKVKPKPEKPAKPAKLPKMPGLETCNENEGRVLAAIWAYFKPLHLDEITATAQQFIHVLFPSLRFHMTYQGFSTCCRDLQIPYPTLITIKQNPTNPAGTLITIHRPSAN